MTYAPTDIFKNREQSLYVDMIQNYTQLDMETMKISENGDDGFQIISVQKKWLKLSPCIFVVALVLLVKFLVELSLMI